MKAQLLLIVFLLAGMMVMFSANHINPQKFDKITVKEFEMVDKNGQQRASIKVEDDGEVVLRLRDAKGTIRVKLGANEDGSGLILLDDSTNPGLHALAKSGGTSLTLMDKAGTKREY
jgi:hypothetical protein